MAAPAGKRSDRLQHLLHEAEILRRNGSLAQAEQRYRAAARLDPQDATVLVLLGTVLVAQERLQEASQVLRRAAALDPGGVDAHYNLGVAQQRLGRHEEAVASYARAVALDPDYGEAHNNLGNALQSAGRHQEALAHYERAIAAVPGYGIAHNNRGNALKALARYREAIASYGEALAIDPQDADAHYYTGLARLCLGEYAEGFREYEWRWKRPGAPRPARALPQPLWLGAEDLRGKSILLHAEQGLGDAIQFLRYAPLVAKMGATVLLQTHAPLLPLMRAVPGVSRVLAPGEDAPRTDFHCPLLSLPLAFGTTLQTIPAPGGCFAVDAARTAQWRAQLAEGGEKLVGVVWRGSALYENDAERSIGFAALSPLWEVPGVRFVSLQKELLDEERAPAAALPQLAHPGADFAGTAEMIAALDLVIAVDTGWVHWAGAIGIPAWVMLNFAPHWPWLTVREDSPWYPGARLYRQSAPGDWAPVIARVAAALREAVKP